MEQIINHLREAEVLLAQGQTVGEICRRIVALVFERLYAVSHWIIRRNATE